MAGSLYQFDPGSASDPFTADSLQYVSARPALVVTQHFLHAYETRSCLPTHLAVTLSMYTLIPTVYRALLKSAVSGIGHRIHTTKIINKDMLNVLGRLFVICKHLTQCSLCIKCATTPHGEITHTQPQAVKHVQIHHNFILLQNGMTSWEILP